MHLLNRIKKTLKCKSGASIIFVVGIMMFLMAIGVSTMAAGASNAGALQRQNEYNRILLLSKSVHDNIMYSLQANPEDDVLLGYQLAYALFSAYDMMMREVEDELDQEIDPLPLKNIINKIQIRIGEDLLFDANYPSTDMIHVSGVTFKFPVQDIVDSPAIMLYDSEDNIIEIIKPRTATINARMVVEIEVTARDLRADSNDRRVLSRATYEYKNGRMIGIPVSDGLDEDPDYLMVYEPDGYGTWELVDYEIVDVLN